LVEGVSLTDWVDARFTKALNTLAADLQAESGPLTQNIITGIVTGLSGNTAFIQTMATAIGKGVTDGVTNALLGKIEGIPQDTTNLLQGELNQLPQQIDSVLNIPLAVGQAVAQSLANLPSELAGIVQQSIHSIIPFGVSDPQEFVRRLNENATKAQP
jgi:hypothetical protein